MKALADDKLKVAKTMISVFDCLENIVGKKEKSIKEIKTKRIKKENASS